MTYFTHCSNTRNDERIVALRMKLGAAGYGIYIMLLEKMSETTDCSLTCNYAVLAYDLHVGVAKIQSVVEDFDLFEFTDDITRFYSEDLRRKMINSESNMRPDMQIPQEIQAIESSDEPADEPADESADADDCDDPEDNNDITDDTDEIEGDEPQQPPVSPPDNHHDELYTTLWGRTN